MILDKELMFSDNQTVTTAGPSTNTVDLAPLTHGNTFRDIGVGEPLYLVVGAQAPIVGSTLSITLQTSPDNSAWSTLMTIAMRPGDNRTAAALPHGVKRYLRVSYSGSVTSGAVYAGLVKDAPAEIIYAAGSKFDG